MCRLSQERGKDGGHTEIAGGNTLDGQLVSFIEHLHLSYREVYEVIPYRRLLLMQKDKLHLVYGECLVEMSDEEYLKLKET